MLLRGKMRSIRYLSQVLGIRLRVHYTWLLAIILITVAVVTQFSTASPLWSRIILGIVASFLFFVAIGVREFVLSFVATSKGISVKNVTLFIFGGLSQTDENTDNPTLELLLAMVGMLFNLIIAGIFYMVYFILKYTESIMVNVLMQWMAFIFFMLALFHFIPGFPLDNGRILRALLWRVTGNYQRATRIAGWTGWGIGLILTIGGILILIFTQQWFVGVLLAFPGLVLQNAATHSRRQLATLLSLASND
jgi:Zn-dependent protease